MSSAVESDNPCHSRNASLQQTAAASEDAARCLDWQPNTDRRCRSDHDLPASDESPASSPRLRRKSKSLLRVQGALRSVRQFRQSATKSGRSSQSQMPALASALGNIALGIGAGLAMDNVDYDFYSSKVSSSGRRQCLPVKMRSLEVLDRHEPRSNRPPLSPRRHAPSYPTMRPNRPTDRPSTLRLAGRELSQTSTNSNRRHSPQYPRSPELNCDSDDALDSNDSGNHPPRSPRLNRRLQKSYRLAVSGRSESSAAGESHRSLRPQRHVSYRRAIRQHAVESPNEEWKSAATDAVRTPVVVPPTPMLSSTVDGEFVSITDLKRMDSLTKSRHSSCIDFNAAPQSTGSDRVRCSSVSAVTPSRLPTNTDYSALCLPSKDPFSDSSNSSFNDSDDSIDTRDSALGTSRSRLSSEEILDDESLDSVADIPRKVSPRSLKVRKKGADSVRRLRDRRMDDILDQHVQELEQLKRTGSWSSDLQVKHHHTVQGSLSSEAVS